MDRHIGDPYVQVQHLMPPMAPTVLAQLSKIPNFYGK